MKTWIEGLRNLVAFERGAVARHLADQDRLADALWLRERMLDEAQAARGRKPKQRSGFDQLVETYFRRRFPTRKAPKHGDSKMLARAMHKQACALIERESFESAGAAAQQRHRRDHGSLPAPLTAAERAELKLLQPKGHLPSVDQLAVRVRASLATLAGQRSRS